jgi:uncharacterized protein (DUF983 family)
MMGRWDSDEDFDGEDEEWPENDADDGQMECPYCGEAMYDDSPRCPSCGQYLSQEDVPPAKKPAWIVITAVVVLIIMLSWVANYL